MRRAALLLLLVCAPGAQATGPIPCSSKACKATVRVGGRSAKWVSPQTFPRTGGYLDVDLRYRRRVFRSTAIGDCSAYYYGHGMVAFVTVCGTKLRVRAVSVKHRKRVRITYRWVS